MIAGNSNSQFAGFGASSSVLFSKFLAGNDIMLFTQDIQWMEEILHQLIDGLSHYL
jgi:hypothetical protein